MTVPTTQTTSTILANSAKTAASTTFFDPITVAVLSSAIALAALAVAIISLWRTHFSLVQPITIVGRLRFRIYPIRSEKSRWFIASHDLPISFCNPGAQPVLITRARLKLHFPDIPIPNNKELLDANWDIDPLVASRIDMNRFRWIKDLSPSSWMPFAILPKQTVLKHLIFEARWDDPVIQKNVNLELEIQSSASKQWMRISAWTMHLDAATWGELTNNGTSISFGPNGDDALEDSCTPKDLHKYTGSKAPIPKNGFGAGRSYLDFPKSPNDSSSCG